MKAGSRDYYAARERAERTAADNASCPEARRAHEEMARAYSKLAGEVSLIEKQPDAERPAA
jgi:hypothetical protein